MKVYFANDGSYEKGAIDYESACALMDMIERTCGKEVAYRFRNKRPVYTGFVDGAKLLWMPRDVCHAKRVGRLWCDKKIKNEAEYIVRGFYMGLYGKV